MKILILSILWIVIFMLFFFLLSIIGLLWFNTYKEIITNINWFFAYTIGIASWLVTAIIAEIVEDLE